MKDDQMYRGTGNSEVVVCGTRCLGHDDLRGQIAAAPVAAVGTPVVPSGFGDPFPHGRRPDRLFLKPRVSHY